MAPRRRASSRRLVGSGCLCLWSGHHVPHATSSLRVPPNQWWLSSVLPHQSMRGLLLSPCRLFHQWGGALLRVFAPIPSPHSSAFAAVPSADARPINTTTPCYCVSSFCKHLRGVGHTLSKVEDERSRSFVQGMPRTRPPVTGLLREKLLRAADR